VESTAEDSESNHHLWRNRRTWWIAFTILHDGYRQERVRRSLGTRDVALARARRDELMQTYAAKPGVSLATKAAAETVTSGESPSSD